MATTTPDNIYYATVADGQDLAAVSAAMATSVQLALAGRQQQSFKWANATARGAQTGMIAGDVGYQIDTGLLYVYTTAWNVQLSNRTTMARLATQSIGNGASTPVSIQFDTTYADNNAFTITAGKFVCKTAGNYFISTSVEYGTATTNTRWIMIRKALAATPTTFTPVVTVPWTPVASSTNNGNSTVAPVTLAVGDVVDAATMQTSGGSLSITYGSIDISRI